MNKRQNTKYLQFEELTEKIMFYKKKNRLIELEREKNI